MLYKRILLLTGIGVVLTGCITTSSLHSPAATNVSTPFNIGTHQECEIRINNPTIGEEIQSLKELADKGIISKEEFEQKKQQ
ncbi:SHOCT domain-containing protein [Candidatus Desantisbacteria bacterium]|nr:SHOCT domain-containing protein [Candidatus Desantisbacteria bacterium]